MAVTVSAVSAGSTQTAGRTEDVWGRRRVGLYRVTFDSSYPTGGEAFDPAAQGFQGPVAAVFLTKRYLAAQDDHLVEYDHTNKKLVATVGSTGAEVANATDLSALVVDVLVIGE